MLIAHKTSYLLYAMTLQTGWLDSTGYVGLSVSDHGTDAPDCSCERRRGIENQEFGRNREQDVLPLRSALGGGTTVWGKLAPQKI